MGVVLSRRLLQNASLDPNLIARILGPDRRNVDASVLRSIANDLSLSLTRVAWVIAGLAVAAAGVAWLFPPVVARATR
jgi:hypothetical protein